MKYFVAIFVCLFFFSYSNGEEKFKNISLSTKDSLTYSDSLGNKYVKRILRISNNGLMISNKDEIMLYISQELTQDQLDYLMSQMQTWLLEKKVKK